MNHLCQQNYSNYLQASCLAELPFSEFKFLCKRNDNEVGDVCPFYTISGAHNWIPFSGFISLDFYL
jgi:hypothetical protein